MTKYMLFKDAEIVFKTASKKEAEKKAAKIAFHNLKK